MLFCIPWHHQPNILNRAFLGSLYFLLIFVLIAYHGGASIGIQCALPPTSSHISFPCSPHHQGSWQDGRRQNRTKSAFWAVRGKKKKQGWWGEKTMAWRQPRTPLSSGCLLSRPGTPAFSQGLQKSPGCGKAWTTCGDSSPNPNKLFPDRFHSSSWWLSHHSVLPSSLFSLLSFAQS